MVTWTFDLLALLVLLWAFCPGGLVTLYAWMREGGAWSKGFFDGCEKQALISYLEHERERMRDCTKSPKGVKRDD